MRGRRAGFLGLGVAALLACVGAGWLLSLPQARDTGAGPPVPKAEAAAMLEALAPPKRKRPLVAIIGLNDASETTDYIMPYGILRRADVADVVALGMAPGPVRLYPALTVEPQATAADFDARHPAGADYVIVPAMEPDDDPAVLGWLREQARKGATIVGVCAGAKVVANAGLLDGKRATTHWYSVKTLRKRHPSIHYVPDRRVVVDEGVATSTGVSASMPLTLTLIEAIAGREKAEAVAAELGLRNWDVRHNSAAFRFTRPFALTALRNRLAFWKHERLGMRLDPRVDEVALALTADAWSRTYRSRVVTFAASKGAQISRHGLAIYPDRIALARADDARVFIATEKPAAALDAALHAIADRYGPETARFVAMQLEYPEESTWAGSSRISR